MRSLEPRMNRELYHTVTSRQSYHHTLACAYQSSQSSEDPTSRLHRQSSHSLSHTGSCLSKLAVERGPTSLPTLNNFCFPSSSEKAISQSLYCRLPCTLPPCHLQEKKNSPPLVHSMPSSLGRHTQKQRSTASSWKPLPFQSPDQHPQKAREFLHTKDEANRFTTNNSSLRCSQERLIRILKC